MIENLGNLRHLENLGNQPYLLLKAWHVFGVIIFLGNITVTGFWKAFADLTKDYRIIAFSQRLVTYTDFVFTSIGVIIIIVTGILMATYYYGDYWKVRWIAWGLGLFISSGVIWVAILIPIQIKLHRMANIIRKSGVIPRQYWTYEINWIIFGIIATILPFINLYWMVFKPV